MAGKLGNSDNLLDVRLCHTQGMTDPARKGQDPVSGEGIRRNQNTKFRKNILKTAEADRKTLYGAWPNFVNSELAALKAEQKPSMESSHACKTAGISWWDQITKPPHTYQIQSWRHHLPRAFARFVRKTEKNYAQKR